MMNRSNSPGNVDASVQDARLEAILSREETLLPSSGFAARVMERIESSESAHRSRTAPNAPIRFPWRRALAGWTALCVPVLYFVARTITAPFAPGWAGQGIFPPGSSWLLASPLAHEAFGPALLALTGSYLSVWIAQRFATRSWLAS